MKQKQESLILEIPQHVMLTIRAWRDMGPTEVTGFFITEKGTPLKVIGAIIIESSCTMASVDIKPEAMTAMYNDQITKGIYPDQLGIWWHTHPGNGPHPSAQDWTTFAGLGQDKTLNIMYIIAQGDQEFAYMTITDSKTKLSIESELSLKHPNTKWKTVPAWGELAEQYANCVKRHISVAPPYRDKPGVSLLHQTVVSPKSLFDEHDLPCPLHANKALFEELPSEDQRFFIGLYKKVQQLEITPDEADLIAQVQACGKDFFTDIYKESYTKRLWNYKLQGSKCFDHRTR